MTSRAHGRRGTGGFTIIELLVVVIVIGILASAGLAKYQSFADTARKRTCTMNQSGIETGIGVWTTENTNFNQSSEGFGAFALNSPGWYHGGWSNGGPFSNTWAIANVVRDSKMFWCPSALLANGNKMEGYGSWYDGGYGCNGGANSISNYRLYWNGPGVGGSWNAHGGHWYDPTGSSTAHIIVWCGRNGGFACGGPDGTVTTQHAKW